MVKTILDTPVKPAAPDKSKSPGRLNNFDLIRLLAAVQVMFHHIFNNFELSKQSLDFWKIHNVIHYFPGVPIFFTISGFLVYWSFERNSDNIRKFLKNRALRIYPALWVCLGITLILVAVFNQYYFSIVLKKEFWLYLLAQSTFFQFYFPPLSPDFGLNMPNGAVWTITQELQFYLLVPVIWYTCSRNSHHRAENIKLLLLFLGSYALTYMIKDLNNSTLMGQLFRNCVAPYLFNFLIGVLLYRNFDRLRPLIEGRFLYWLSAFVLYSFLRPTSADIFSIQYWPDLPGLGAIFLLSMTVISAAYTLPGLSEKLLGKNDISYGVYIYHLLVINTLLCFGLKGVWWAMFPTVVITMLLAWLSWTLIERRALRLKSS